VKVDEFRRSAGQEQPPAGSSAALQALWYAAQGDWNRAHTLAQGQDDVDGAWVHAYLHRVEGDLENAAYWYRRAGRLVCSDPLETEWQSIAEALLG